jgi:hypothetical protein
MKLQGGLGMNTTFAATTALVIGAVFLSGCARTGGETTAGAAKVCVPFRTADANAAPAPPTPAVTEPSAALDDCLHRWGYALAGARDPADVVAQAAMTACSGALSRWNQQGLSQNASAEPDATSLTTGEPTNLMAAHAQFTQNRALFYVVQARAGACAPPPARLMPTGEP